MARHIKFAWFGCVALGLVAFGLSGCGSSSAGGPTISLPSVKALLNQALPKGLKSNAVSRSRSTCDGSSQANINTCASQYIQAIFGNYYVSGTGTNVQGYLMNQAAIIDSRTSLYSGASSSSHPCLAATAKPYTIDLSALNPNDSTTPNMLKFTLGQVQCTAAFSSPSSSASGEVFGISGTSSSVWVTLTDMAGDSLATGGAFINAANIDNSATPEKLDGLAVNYGPANSTGPANLSVARYKAQMTTPNPIFELFFASTSELGITGFAGPTSGAGNGANAFITPGFRMVSDGVNIYADGTLCTTSMPNCGQLSSYNSFSVCLDATSLAVVDPTTVTNCATVANLFTLSPNATPITAAYISGFPNTVTSNTTAALTPLNLFSFWTSTGTWADEGAGPGGTLTGSIPASVMTALNGAYAISNASSVTTAF